MTTTALEEVITTQTPGDNILSRIREANRRGAGQVKDVEEGLRSLAYWTDHARGAITPPPPPRLPSQNQTVRMTTDGLNSLGYHHSAAAQAMAPTVVMPEFVEDPNAQPWTPKIDFINHAAVAQILRDAAADRLACFRGEALPDEQERLDHNGHELIEAILREPSGFGHRLRAVHHVGRVNVKWAGDRRQLLEAEIDHANGFLNGPEKPRWNRMDGGEALNLAVDSLRKLDHAVAFEELSQRFLDTLPVELGRAVGRVLEEAGPVDAAMHRAWLLVGTFEAGSPLESLQEQARSSRHELALDPESPLPRRLLQGIEDRAADLDGPEDEQLQDVCQRAAALRARIKRISELADAACEDASSEISVLRKQLKPLDAEVAERRSSSPRYARQRTLCEQATAGDVEAIADLHRFALTLPGEFPDGFAASIREAVVTGFVAAGFGRWSAESGLFWS
jgi:hypothetical protein